MMWPWPHGPAELPRTPSTSERVLSRARHASFSPEVAERLVHDLSRRRLRRIWDDTTRLLEQPLTPELRFNIVVLRDEVLTRLEQRRRTTGLGRPVRPRRTGRP